MSILEVIGMKKFVVGGAVVAALFASVPAVAQSAPANSQTANSQAPKHPRRNFFTADQSRADIPARVKKMFGTLDLNHDGFVTKDELAASQARFDQRTAKAAPKRAAKAFDRVDSDHDGKVTLAEVQSERTARLASRGKPAKASHALPSLFRFADANKDGIVTRAEFDTAVNSGKIKPRHAHMRGNEIARLFESADVDKDGRLSLEEAQRAALQRFDSMDLNRDAVLTADERRQANKASRVRAGAGN
jgi:Ca2+-binding EF-hand superfamily protein